jgi:hypothetical protein
MHRWVNLCLLAACAGPIGAERPGPRGLRADQHLDLAAREEERADELAHSLTPHAGTDDASVNPPLASGTWFDTWGAASEHRLRAQTHRSAAAKLKAEYDQACGPTPTAAVSVSPLQRYAVDASPIADGALLLLSSDAGPPDRLLAAMRCHRAWMMLGHADTHDCPLDLSDIHVAARADASGIQLTITAGDPSLVPELRRRAAHDLQVAHHLQAARRLQVTHPRVSSP